MITEYKMFNIGSNDSFMFWLMSMCNLLKLKNYEKEGFI